jgi:hypothetical protein
VCRAARSIVIHRRHPDKAGLKRTDIDHERVHIVCVDGKDIRVRRPPIQVSELT